MLKPTVFKDSPISQQEITENYMNTLNVVTYPIKYTAYLRMFVLLIHTYMQCFVV